MSEPLAYFVMAHQRPEQLRLLVETLVAAPAGCDDLLLLHIDQKSRLGLKPERRGMWRMARALAAEHRNLHLLPSRFTNWGGWSLSALHLHAIARALDLSPHWSHFVNLSGQCFPIKPIAEVRAALARQPEAVFVEMRPFASLPPDDWHLRWHPMIELPHKAIKLPGPRRPPENFELAFKGSQWSILPRAFCAWQRTAPVARDIRRYLCHLLLSDELIVQTLVRNGPWRDRVAGHYGREIVWPGPKVFTRADLPRLLASPAFFARKFDPLVDDAVVPALLGAIAPAQVAA